MSRNVIIIDDNHFAIEGILSQINWPSLNAEITGTFNDGYSAIEYAQSHDIDLVISDIEMPGISGIELCSRLIQIKPDIRMILISAFDKFDYAKKAIRIGVVDYIEKPISYPYLSEKLASVFRSMDQEDRTRTIVEQSKPLIQEKLISDLIGFSGAEAEERLSRYSRYLSLDFNYSSYCVLKIRIENADSIEKDFGVQRYQMDVISIEESARKSGSVFDWFYCYHTYDAVYCIIGQNTNSTEHFLTVIHKFADIIITNSDATAELNIGIGTIVPRISMLHESAENAEGALKYRFCFPHDTIYDAYDTEKHSFSFFPENGRDTSELFQLIASKNTAQIRVWLRDYFDALAKECTVKNILFSRIHILIGDIIHFCYEVNIDISDMEEDITKLYRRFDRIHDYNELFEWMCGFCLKVGRCLDTSTESYHEHICSQASQFISENYSDNSLSLSDIARHVGISSAYLSALYKKVYGKNIFDTITSLRLEKACQLLQQSTLPLKEISIRCGYSNQYYFSNSFKKKYGQSPSLYRKAENN